MIFERWGAFNFYQLEHPLMALKLKFYVRQNAPHLQAPVFAPERNEIYIPALRPPSKADNLLRPRRLEICEEYTTAGHDGVKSYTPNNQRQN